MDPAAVPPWYKEIMEEDAKGVPPVKDPYRLGPV
jgi:hypothetical protein